MIKVSTCDDCGMKTWKFYSWKGKTLCASCYMDRMDRIKAKTDEVPRKIIHRILQEQEVS